VLLPTKPALVRPTTVGARAQRMRAAETVRLSQALSPGVVGETISPKARTMKPRVQTAAHRT